MGQVRGGKAGNCLASLGSGASKFFLFPKKRLGGAGE